MDNNIYKDGTDLLLNVAVSLEIGLVIETVGLLHIDKLLLGLIKLDEALTPKEESIKSIKFN